VADVSARLTLKAARADVAAAVAAHADDKSVPVHPLRLVSDLQKVGGRGQGWGGVRQEGGANGSSVATGGWRGGVPGF
jgi:hypothetical protein